MTKEDFSPTLVAHVPAASPDEASSRIANLTIDSLEPLTGTVYSDMEQFRKAMNEAGYMTAYRMKKESANKISRIYVADSTCKDGSKWESTLWEHGRDRGLVTLILTVQTKKADAPDEEGLNIQ